MTIAPSSSHQANHQAPVKLVIVENPEVTYTDIKRMKLCGLGLSYNPSTGNVAVPNLTSKAEQIILGSNRTQQAESVRCAMTEVTEQLHRLIK